MPAPTGASRSHAATRSPERRRRGGRPSSAAAAATSACAEASGEAAHILSEGRRRRRVPPPVCPDSAVCPGRIPLGAGGCSRHLSDGWPSARGEVTVGERYLICHTAAFDHGCAATPLLALAVAGVGCFPAAAPPATNPSPAPNRAGAIGPLTAGLRPAPRRRWCVNHGRGRGVGDPASCATPRIGTSTSWLDPRGGVGRREVGRLGYRAVEFGRTEVGSSRCLGCGCLRR